MQKKSKVKHILYFYPHRSTFIERDITLLRTVYVVKPFEFHSKSKWRIIIEFIRQAIFIIFQTRPHQIWICHFAGHSSLLPAFFGKIFRKRCFIIVAGTDAACFPSINYGNFNKKLLAWSTSKSLEWCTMILPVHKSLVYQKYEYDPAGAPAQGYTVFAPKTRNTPFKAIPYGYDSNFFQPDLKIRRIPNSYITIGILDDKNVFYRKGMDLVLELAEVKPDASFTIVGGENAPMQLPKNVKLLPKCSLEEIVRLLSSHTFYLQLSLMEGFPNALAEAMLCGCIPIGSNISAIPDMIGECGIIIEKKDVNLLNERIISFVNNNDISTYAHKARLRILSNFTEKNRLAMLMSAME